MKSITALMMLMILLASHASSAQTKADYLTKSKHQKTAAWILLGGGSGLGMAGLIVGTHGLVDLGTGQVEKAGKNLGNGGLLILTGGAAMLGSIPLFCSRWQKQTQGDGPFIYKSASTCPGKKHNGKQVCPFSQFTT